MNSTDFKQFPAPCCTIVRKAGELILAHDPARLEVRQKDDRSPVTAADQEANDYIVSQLKALTPDIPVVAEEDEIMAAAGSTRFWLVDPLDGTRSFAEGMPDYTVNIGLIENGRPALGVVYCPPTRMLYYNIPGEGAFRVNGDGAPERIRTRTPPQEMVVVKSRSHPSPKTSAFLETLPAYRIVAIGSSIKFCHVAEGSADIYPRFGNTMEWDTAAGHAILNAAGGNVQTPEGAELTYGKPEFKNPHFIARG